MPIRNKQYDENDRGDKREHTRRQVQLSPGLTRAHTVCCLLVPHDFTALAIFGSTRVLCLAPDVAKHPHWRLVASSFSRLFSGLRVQSAASRVRCRFNGRNRQGGVASSTVRPPSSESDIDDLRLTAEIACRRGRNNEGFGRQCGDTIDPAIASVSRIPRC